MRILSATVRNYRIHREQTVPFSDFLTLIGGPNESGKSTLTEAIHRALFLKATVTGKVQESMVSDYHSGHPEVEVSFEAGGKTFQVRKTFSKASGKTTLSEEGGPTLHGIEAETRLAELMQVEEAGGGTGGAKKALSQWAHLWVWQGQGGADPSDHASSQQDALLSRLKEQGGGAAMQSDLDSKVAGIFQEKFDTLFTKSGKSKAGSDLQKADEERQAAAEAADNAKEAFARLEGAVRDFQQAEEILLTRERESKNITVQLEASREKRKAVTELQHQIELATRTLAEARSRHELWTKSLEEVDRLQDEVKQLSEQAKPGAEKLSALNKSLKEKKAALDSAEADIEALDKEYNLARAKWELIEIWGHLLSSRNRKAELEESRKSIQTLQEKRQENQDELARLPAIDETIFQDLQRLDGELSEANAVLEAMSTGIELVKSNRSVQAGNQEIEQGEELVIHEETLVQAGDDLVLKITPGGGTGLEQARKAAADLRSAREQAFQKAGIKTLAEAGEIRGKRQALESALREIVGELNGKNVEGVEKEFAELNQNLATHEADIERRASLFPNFSAPTDLSEARSRYQEGKDELDGLQAGIESAKTRQAAAKQSVADAESEWAREKEAAQSAEHRLIEIRAQLKATEEPLGTPEEREKESAKRRDEWEKATASLAASQEKVKQLQPETIEADISRFERAIQNGKQEIEKARDTRASARTLLQSDGTIDPAGVLATARARAEATEERHRSLFQRAEAIRLLRDQFLEEQQKLSDRFSRPLADKVSGYLQQIFGSSASATVSVEEGIIGGWTMSRNGSTFDFEHLSGGTREQVSAAVRLAIAEILAADHGGSLPVVFDDAFTNSDPDRIQSLQRMLDLAARNGLQIILLTCDPGNYGGLGAETVSLDSGAM